jgi:hypothetical protein
MRTRPFANTRDRTLSNSSESAAIRVTMPPDSVSSRRGLWSAQA